MCSPCHRVCLPSSQAFAERGAGEVGDDNIVNQLRYKRNMLGDLIAAKDVQVGSSSRGVKGVKRG